MAEHQTATPAWSYSSGYQLQPNANTVSQRQVVLVHMEKKSLQQWGWRDCEQSGCEELEMGLQGSPSSHLSGVCSQREANILY